MIPNAQMNTAELVIETLRRKPPAFLGSGTRRMRNVAYNLAMLVNQRSGCGKLTLEQIGEACNYSTKWTSLALQELESLGLIEWRRGGIKNGKTFPSFFKIIKRAWSRLARACWEVLRGTVDDFKQALELVRKRPERKTPNQSMRNKIHDFPSKEGISAPAVGALIQSKGISMPRPCPHSDPRGWRACFICKREVAEGEMVEEYLDTYRPKPHIKSLNGKAWRAKIREMMKAST